MTSELGLNAGIDPAKESQASVETEKKFKVKDIVRLRELLDGREPDRMSLRGYRNCEHMVSDAGKLTDNELGIDCDLPIGVSIESGSLQGWAYRLTFTSMTEGMAMLKSPPTEEGLEEGMRVAVEIPIKVAEEKVADFIEGCDVGYVLK
ncbi:hypothetical protein KC614_04015 [candidate division WWE3 bacterium]|uniref:Uncharacterized protein n=1 Tax=candidate division WWE3 bacterium TaxID=2053526 RepID=A0A955LKT3_UNCKA|nr:hypothetical protein [candidate division WWE3 bacterium]